MPTASCPPKDGTDASRAEYMEANESFYEELVKYDVEIGLYQLGDPIIEFSRSPGDWTA